jgi:hypothetical protein
MGIAHRSGNIGYIPGIVTVSGNAELGGRAIAADALRTSVDRAYDLSAAGDIGKLSIQVNSWKNAHG